MPKTTAVEGSEKTIKGAKHKKKVALSTAKSKLAATAKDAAKRGDTSTLKKLKTIVGKTFKSKAAKKIAKRGVKAIPVLGGVVAGLASGDTHAAVPVLGEADRLGPKKGSVGHDIENPSLSRAQRRKAVDKALAKRKKK